MKLSEFLSKNFHFLVVNFLVYLNRRVFIMIVWCLDREDCDSLLWHFLGP